MPSSMLLPHAARPTAVYDSSPWVRTIAVAINLEIETALMRDVSYCWSATWMAALP
jgi:hypothetical protein